MKNINKNLILSLGIGLTILAILAFGSLLMPKAAHAAPGYVAGRYDNNGNYSFGGFTWNDPAPTPQVITVYQPVYQTQPVAYQNNYVQPQANTSNTDASTRDPKVTSVGVTTDDYSNLTANSLFGRFSFMPSGLMQWILLGIFILVIVILIRKVSGKDEEYYTTPLKHA